MINHTSACLEGRARGNQGHHIHRVIIEQDHNHEPVQAELGQINFNGVITITCANCGERVRIFGRVLAEPKLPLPGVIGNDPRTD